MNGFQTNFPNQFNNNFNGQNGMNQMGMNQMGNNMNQIMMNQILMNQMGMNPMVFNQMGMAGQMNMNDMSKLIQMNNPNFNNANNNNIDFNQDNSNGLSVTFKRNDPQNGELKVVIQCLYTESIKDVIKKYRIKSGDTNLLERFVFNTKNLCPTLTVAEQGLINNSIITVIDIRDMEGGYIK